MAQICLTAMPYDKQMRLHDHHEYEEESPMLRDHLSNDGLVVSEEASWTKRNPGNSMARFRYGLLFICATVIVVSLSFFLGIQFDTHGFDRRCMKHASMYCRYLIRSSVRKTFITYTPSSCVTGNGPAMDICAVQRDARAPDRMDRRSKPRG